MTRHAIREFAASDRDAMLAFAAALPEHDLLFLGRDIKHPRVVDAWLAAIAEGDIDTWVALDNAGTIVGTAALVRDPLGWSPHVGEVRILVAPAARGHGLGRDLLETVFRKAVARDCRKLVAKMTPDQSGAIALFETIGFRGEALLHDHVRGRDGEVHDLAILSLDVQRAAAMLEAFGLQGK